MQVRSLSGAQRLRQAAVDAGTAVVIGAGFIGVAAVLDNTQQPGKSVAESVATALEGRVRLLVFDNCEHLCDAVADLVEAILARSGSFKILPTSREGLRVADEQL